MPYVIHVSQGRSARLTRESLDLDITALYTDNFSTCCILVCISLQRLMLRHVDRISNLDLVKKDLNWAHDETSTIFLISRPDEGKLVAENLLENLSSQFVIHCVEVDADCRGVSISFECRKAYKVHPQINLYNNDKKPDFLLYHPKEQQFAAIYKMAAIPVVLGLQTSMHHMQHCVFDSFGWEKINTDELAIPKDLPAVSSESAFMDVVAAVFQIFIRTLPRDVHRSIKLINAIGPQRANKFLAELSITESHELSYINQKLNNIESTYANETQSKVTGAFSPKLTEESYHYLFS